MQAKASLSEWLQDTERWMFQLQSNRVDQDINEFEQQQQQW